MKKLFTIMLLTLSFIVGSTLTFAQADEYAGIGNPNPEDRSVLTYNDIKRVSTRRAQGDKSPIIRIVSPLADAFVTRGESSVGAGSPNGTGFLINLEIVTRDNVPVTVNESTLAPPDFGIRDVSKLGQPNPEFPGLYVFIDKDFVTPAGTIIERNTNLAALFNVAGTDDTPGPGVTVWAGWHVLESFLPRASSFRLTAAIIDNAGRIGFDEIDVRISRVEGRTSAQALTPSPSTFPGAAARFSSLLTGAAERPDPVTTNGTGTGTVTYNKQTGVARVTVNFENLAGNQTIAHIHTASADAPGPIVFDIDTNATPPTTNTGTFSLDWQIDPINLQRLQEGLLYFNVHSTTFPAGEIRGQIQPVTNEATAPEISMIAPRVPTSIAVGPTSGLNASNGSLHFIQVTAVDRSVDGIAVNETGIREGNSLPIGLIFDPSQIPNTTAGNAAGPNRNYPGLHVSFDVPLQQPNGNIVPAGVNLAPLFDIVGSEVDAQGRAIRITADWVVGGSLLIPTGKESVTITSRVTDNAGHTGETKSIVGVSRRTSGQSLTTNP